jgi:hypothetical protein
VASCEDPKRRHWGIGADAMVIVVPRMIKTQHTTQVLHSNYYFFTSCLHQFWDPISTLLQSYSEEWAVAMAPAVKL